MLKEADKEEGVVGGDEVASPLPYLRSYGGPMELRREFELRNEYVLIKMKLLQKIISIKKYLNSKRFCLTSYISVVFFVYYSFFLIKLIYCFLLYSFSFQMNIELEYCQLNFF